MPESSVPNRSRYIARVEKLFDHNSDTRSLFIRLPIGQKLKFVAGQFISISIPLPDEVLRRPYTIASILSPSDLLEICFNRVPAGRGVGWLFERAVGDSIEFMGPFGAFTLDAPPSRETVFIAEGTAIAPIRPMLHRACSGKHAPLFLLYAAFASERILYRNELTGLASRDAKFKFETMVADLPASDLYARLLDDVNRRWVAGDTDRARQFYVCGVGNDVMRVRDLLRGCGYERRAVHYEQW